MRRFSLLAALLLSFLVPGAVSAAGCPPGVPEGLVDKDVYRVGEIVDFFDSYHDFGDPGTVTITFERRSDGLTREFTAFNGPDGTWYRQVTFDSAADAGRWDVTVVVDQTDGLDTCTDTFTLRARASVPNTSTVDPVTTGGAFNRALVILLAMGTLLGAWAALGRGADVRAK